jgi:hypothetical protein
MRNLLLKLTFFCVAAGLVASVALGAAPPKGWQNLQLSKDDGVFPLGFASGRVWFVVEGTNGDDFLESARVGSTGLSSLVVTPEGQSPWLPSAYILGSSLVTLQGHSSGIAPLLAGGRMGATTPLPGDPEKTASALAPQGTTPDSWFARAALNVGGRTIWAVNGHSCPNPNSGPHRCTANGGGLSSLVMCCTAAGQAADLTNLLSSPTKAGATDMAMGTDAHKRVWLVWLDGAQGNAKGGPGEIKLVQIDPSTLRARTTKSINGFFFPSSSSPFTLACSDTCRAVYEGRTGIFSWGGDGPPILVLASDPRRGTGGSLMAASGSGSTLRIAWLAHKPATDGGLLLTVSRGDARGRNLRAVSSVEVPPELPAGGTHYYYPPTPPVLIPTPSNMVVLALYGGGPGGTSRLLDAVLRG